MGLIENLRLNINNLTKENERLKSEKEIIENDITKFSINVKEIFQLIDIDFNQKSFNIMQTALKVGKKVMIKGTKDEITLKWNEIMPILDKYEHLTKDTNKPKKIVF